MSGSVHPAFAAFLAELKGELVLAQLLVARREGKFELCHLADRNMARASLQMISLAEVRALVDSTATRQFRPLKSAPNLRTGWFLVLAAEEQLQLALDQFYPNAVADWFAARSGNPPVTHYREFTGRQTGMYRITTMLSDAQAADVIRACCHKKFCLKHRLWTVEGLSADAAGEKSIIPCLEPCAVLLEFARKGMRMEQEEKATLSLAPSDIATIHAALQRSLENPDGSIREADFASAANPRRLQLVIEKLNSSGNTLANASERE